MSLNLQRCGKRREILRFFFHMQPPALGLRFAEVNYLAAMRKILFTLAVCGLSFSNLSGQTDTSSPTTPQNVMIEISADMTRDDLAATSKTLAEQGISFRYDNIEWANGAMQTIRMAVKCADGTVKVSDVMTVNADSPTRFGVTYVQGKPQICFGKECG
jgi:hypothetical protein